MAYERIIRHLDTDSVTQKAVLSDTSISDPRAVQMSFELLRIGGCGSGTLVLKDKFTDRADLEIGEYIAADYEAGDRWYLGRIESIDATSPQGVTVSLYGQWAELNEVFPGGFSPGAPQAPYRLAKSDWFANDPDHSLQSGEAISQPDEVVSTLWNNYISPATNIRELSTNERADPAPGLESYVFRGEESAASILRSLATVNKSCSVGVDAEGKLFFKQKRSTVLATFQEGTDIEGLDYSRDRSLLFNRILLTGDYVYGTGTGPGFYRYRATFQRTNSINTYGEKSVRLFVPYIRRNSDATQFAKEFFRVYGAPTTRYSFQTDPQTAILKPWDGQVTLKDSAGTTLTTDQFDRVQVDFNQVPVFRMTLGPEDLQFPTAKESQRFEVHPGHDAGDGESTPQESLSSLGSYAGTSAS